MQSRNISREDGVLGALALLLVIDLLLLPWFSLGGGSVGSISIPSVDLSATDAPDGWLGILAVLAALAVVADIAVENLSPQTTVPAIGGSRRLTRLLFAAAAGALLALKFLLHIHFSLFGFGFWAACVLAAGLIFVATERGAEALRQGAPAKPVSPTRPDLPNG